MKEQAYFAAIPIKVLQDNSIYHSYRILYGQIASYANTSGCCWATNETLGKAIDLSESSVSRGIKELAIRGHIKAYIDKETGNKRRIYPQQSSDIPDEEKGKYTLLYQDAKVPPIRTHADRGYAPTPTPIRTHADIIEINEEDKKECTGDSQVSILNESSAPQVNANPETRGSDDKPPLSVQNTLSKNETDYKQTLMGLIKKFAREFWERPDIEGFVDYCWKEGKEFEVKVWNRKKYVPGLEALLKTHFEGEIGEMNKKKEELKADHSDAEKTVKEFLNMCLDNWHNEWRSYRKHVEIYKGKRDVLASDYEALKKLYMDNKWNEVTFVFEVYGRHKNKMYEMMGFEWSKFAANKKATLEEALNFYNERKSWVIPGWPKQQS